MKEHEKARRLLERAIAAIGEEIRNPCPALIKYEITQSKLQVFRAELDKMLKEVNAGAVSRLHQERTWMGHAVVDGWPLSSDARQGCSLGELIAQAENAYEEIPVE